MPSLSRYYADVPRQKPLKDVLADNLRAVMEELGLKQQHVATRAKQAGASVDQRTVGRVRQGTYPATVATLDAIAIGLGIDAWQLLRADLDVKALVKRAPADLSEEEAEQLANVKSMMQNFTAAQRDLFIQDEVTRSLVGEYFPVDQMLGDWTGPHVAQPKPRPYAGKKSPKSS